MIIWTLVGIASWTVIAIGSGVIIGKSIAIADQHSEPPETPTRHLHLVS